MAALLVCVKIFLGRILDVSIGTVRTVISVKGQKFAASVLAFFEVFIWYYVARSALNTPLTSIFVPISYSLGYATGTFIGTTLSRKVIKGNTSIQVITSKASKTNLEKIRKSGYGITIIDVYDTYDDKKKKLLLMEVKNKNIKELNSFLTLLLFYSHENIKGINLKSMMSLVGLKDLYDGLNNQSYSFSLFLTELFKTLNTSPLEQTHNKIKILRG